MLHRLEITGWDRSVEVADIAALSARYAPLEVEWGVVVQRSKMRAKPPRGAGAFRPRNPDWSQIEEAAQAGLRLACHASGSVVLSGLLRGRDTGLGRAGALEPFQTLQLNTTHRAQPFEAEIGGATRTYTSYVRFVEALLEHDALRIEASLARLEATTDVIVQVRVVPGAVPVVPAPLLALAQRCRAAGKITRLLLDTSGGRGVADFTKWPGYDALDPETRGFSVGFAGGIGPETLDAALARLPEVLAPGATAWLGMESGVRASEPDPKRPGKQRSRFDLARVERVLRACAPYHQAEA